jgi:hypothetical protein
MFAVRSAMFLFLALHLSVSPSPVAASTVEPSGAGALGAAVSRTVAGSIGEPGVASLNEATSHSRVAFRRARVKAIVLEDTDREQREADLGPVHIPRTLHAHTSIASSPPFFPKTCRLRC